MFAPLFCALLAASAPRQAGVPVGTGTERPVVRLTAPAGGWSVDRMLLIEGTVSDPTVDPIVLSINGDRYLLRTLSAGAEPWRRRGQPQAPAGEASFSRKFPAASGKNVITVIAANRGGTTTAQVTTYAQIPPVPLKAVLTSDTDGVYTDLHIYEPTRESQRADGSLDRKKMAHVYWANTASPSGGTFYLNEQGGSFDQPGYGPYLYVHRAPPRGVFVIAANYWPSGDKAHTLATLNVVVNEGTPNESRRLVRVPLATPGTTKVLAFVNFVGDGVADLYVPGQDPAPTDPRWPKNLDESASQVVNNVESGGGD